MKLSAWSSYYYDLTPEEAIRTFKAHGFDYCELSDEHSAELLKRGDPITVGAEFGKFAKEIGIELLQGNLFLNARLCNDENRDLLKKQLDLFRAVGVKNAVLHLDSLAWRGDSSLTVEKIREENCKALKELLDYIKGSDIVICLENLIFEDYLNSADSLMYFIERLNSKNLGVCLDTGHLNLAGGDQTEFIKKMGKYIKALHLDDNEGQKTDQHLMPFGRGNIDFVPIIRETKKLNYERLYNFEIPGERNAPLEILGYKLDYIKKVTEYLDRATEE